MASRFSPCTQAFPFRNIRIARQFACGLPCSTLPSCTVVMHPDAKYPPQSAMYPETVAAIKYSAVTNSVRLKRITRSGASTVNGRRTPACYQACRTSVPVCLLNTREPSLCVHLLRRLINTHCLLIGSIHVTLYS